MLRPAVLFFVASFCYSSWCNTSSYFVGEKGYDPKYFHYRVERIFIDDHNVPALQWVLLLNTCTSITSHAFALAALIFLFSRDMLKFTASVREWMNQDEKNIIAIHCKGGKGKASCVQPVYAMNYTFLSNFLDWSIVWYSEHIYAMI